MAIALAYIYFDVNIYLVNDTRKKIKNSLISEIQFVMKNSLMMDNYLIKQTEMEIKSKRPYPRFELASSKN